MLIKVIKGIEVINKENVYEVLIGISIIAGPSLLRFSPYLWRRVPRYQRLYLSSFMNMSLLLTAR